MKKSMASLVLIFAGAGLAAAGGPAMSQLQGAAAAPADARQWADGGKALPSLAADIPGQPGNSAVKATPAAPQAAQAVPTPQVSTQRVDNRSSDGAAVGFMAGFIAVESPAIALSQIPLVGWLLGGLAAAVLFVPAVIVGGVGALVGSFF